MAHWPSPSANMAVSMKPPLILLFVPFFSLPLPLLHHLSSPSPLPSLTLPILFPYLKPFSPPSSSLQLFLHPLIPPPFLPSSCLHIWPACGGPTGCSHYSGHCHGHYSGHDQSCWGEAAGGGGTAELKDTVGDLHCDVNSSHCGATSGDSLL